MYKADISAQEGWCSHPSVSLNLLQHIYTTLLVTVQRQFVNDSVHFAKLKSRQLQIYSKSPIISIANLRYYKVVFPGTY